MINDKKFIESIKDFGLNQYESKIWLAILSRGVSTAGELSDISNVPRSRSYDVLESLEKKGFIVMKLGKPIKYLAVSPNEVIERVKKKIKDEMNEKENLINTLKGSEMIDELNTLFTQGVDMVEPSELTASLKGKENVYNHFQLMISSAAESIKLMTTEEGLIKKANAFSKIFKKVSERGVYIHIIVPKIKNHRIIDEISKYADIKESDKIYSRFMVVDGKEIIFMLLDDKEVHPSYDVGVWVNTPFFAESISNMFDMVYEIAESKQEEIKKAQ